MPTNAITKQLHLYFGVDGTLLDKSGDVFANPQDDEIFEINAYIEDGVVNNQTTLINFTPNDRMAYTSHWFTMFYRELVEYIVPNESEPKTFAKFTIKVPSIVLLIKGGKVQFEQRITIVQRYGNTHLGNFATVTDLNVAYPPNETLDDNNDVAFVYSNESGETTQVGFYQVEYDGSNYAWVKKETLLYNLQTKQYNVLGFTVNVGMANPSGVPTISESVIYQLMQEISHVYIDINALEVQVIENKDLAYENVLLSTENDWDLETIFTEEFANSRNGWVQVDNEIYVFGGSSFLGTGKDPLWSEQLSKKSYKYNVITKQWTELAQREYNYNEERAVYKDGFIYLFGALNPSGIVGVTSTAYSIHVCQKYEIATNTFTMLADAPLRILATSGAVLVGNKIYVMVDMYSTFNGLETPVTITSINTTPYVYDIATNTWEVKTPANIKFDRGYSYYYNGLIYVQRSLKFQAYNPTTDTWITDLTPPTYGVVHTGLIHEFRGRLFIGSGWESAEAKNNPFIQYYDVTEDKWFIATRLEFKNHALGYGSMFLYDNKLYYIGGYSNEAEPNFNNLIRSFDLEKLQFEEIDYQRQLIKNNEDTINNMLDGTTIVKKAEQDKNGNDIVTTYETKNDATNKLSFKADKTYVDSQDQALDGRVTTLEEKTTTIYDYKGSVLFENLPTTGQVTGDTYNILNDFTLGGEDYLAGTNVAWNGTTWDALGSHIPTADEIDFNGTGTNYLASDVNVDEAIKTLDGKVKDNADDIALKEDVANKKSVINDSETEYPNSKAVKNMLLNMPIVELNNHTLKEVFEDGNLIANGTFENLNGWNVGFANIVNNELRGDLSNGFYATYNYGENPISKYYFNIDVYRDNTGTIDIYLRNRTTIVSNVFEIRNIANTKTNYKTIFNTTETSDRLSIIRYQLGNYVYLDNVRLINMNSLGISSLTFAQMDYWFSVYQGLKTSETDTIFSMLAPKQQGKKIYSFGDSILGGVPDYSYITFASLIADKYGMDYTKYAIGGATLTVQSGETNNILNQVNNASETTPNYILFNGYTNDCSVPNITTTLLGSITSDFTDTFDTSTFCGGLEKTIYTLVTKYRGAKIVFVTTHINSARNYTVQKTLYTKAMEICSKWGIAVADVFTESNFNTFIMAYSTNYTDGGSHPNEEGYKLFYLPVVENKIIY